MRLGDLDFPIDPQTLESGAISWTDASAPARAASIGCPARATRRLEELEAAARLQSALAATAEASGRWCPATSGFVEVDGREAFYVVSQLPDGAQPLAALLEAAAAEPAGLAERRRATLAWSLGVGALRALLDLHERGTHHGELSPESAMRDRIVVRRRTTDPKDLEVDVALQFPSPRLALLLETKRQPEVGSAEQTDVARLAHILRAILHGRDVLDPETRLDDMLLSRVFGAQHRAWQAFFEDAAAGALHADPEFIRRQLALLEPARPAEGGSGQLHDALFKLRRLFAKPAARWGAAAAAGALVATVGLVLAWDTLFPPPTWTVVRDGDDELWEGNTLRIKTKTEGDGSSPPKVVATALKSGARFTEIEFSEDGSNWIATLPDSDANYTIIFADKNRTSIEVFANNADPEFQLVQADGNAFARDKGPQSDDDGELEIYIGGSDEDSPLLKPPTVELQQARSENRRSLQLTEHSTQQMSEGSGASTVWKGTSSLRELQAEYPKTFKVFVNGKDIGDARLRDVPYILKLDPSEGLAEGQAVSVALEIKKDRNLPRQPLEASVRYDRNELGGKAATLPLSRDGLSEAFTLPESSGNYQVIATVGNLEVRREVEAKNDQPVYKLQLLEDQPAESQPFEVALEITATDPDSPSIDRPPLTANDTPAEFVSKDSYSQAGTAARWTGKVAIPRGESAQTVKLAVGSETLEVKVPAAQQIPTAGRPPPPPPPPPVTLTARSIHPDSDGAPAAPHEGGRVRIQPELGNVAEEQRTESYATLEWRLDRAPDELKPEIERQLGVINSQPTRTGEITVPEHYQDYSLELSLLSIGDNRLDVGASSLVIPVTAENAPPETVVTLTSRNGKVIERGTADPVELDSADLTIAITVTDRDSPPKPPEVQVNGLPFTPDERSRDRQTAEFVANIPTPRGDTVITIADKSYKVRWEPRDPIAAGLPDYGWTEQNGVWISESIGVSSGPIGVSSGDFTSAAESQPFEATQLQRLLNELNGYGFSARLMSADELSKEMKALDPRSKLPRPNLPRVVQSLIGKNRWDTLKQSPVNATVSWIDRALYKEVPNVQDNSNVWRNLTPSPLDRSVQATFCGSVDPAQSLQIMGLTETGLSALLGQDSGLLKAAFDAVWSSGAWDPKPWPDAVKPTTAFARVVLTKSERESATSP